MDAAGPATLGPKIGDAASLWNFTPSPGWTREEVHALKICLMKFGVGKWVQIVNSGVLPGKLIQQLNGQTQRLLGQQSLAAFTGLQVDIDRVRADNEAKQGPDVLRKSGIIINSGGKLSSEDLKAQREENVKKYGLTAEEIAAIVLPEPVKPLHASATIASRGGFKPRPGKKLLAVSLMTCDVKELSRAQKMQLLQQLRGRLKRVVSQFRGKAGGAKGAGKGGAKGGAGKRSTSRRTRVAMDSDDEADGLSDKDEAALGAIFRENSNPEERSNRPVRQSRKRGAPAWRGMLSGGDGAALDDITNDDEDLASLVAMGFDEKKSREALMETNRNVQLAVNWLIANCA